MRSIFLSYCLLIIFLSDKNPAKGDKYFNLLYILQKADAVCLCSSQNMRAHLQKLPAVVNNTLLAFDTAKSNK